MNNLLENILNKKVIVIDMYNSDFSLVIFNKFKFSKKYDAMCTYNKNQLFDMIDLIKQSIINFDYFIIFSKNIYENLKNLVNELKIEDKIIFLDKICKKILEPPFDYTIEEIVSNLDNTFYYIFGICDDILYSRIKKILKIMKYLKLNTFCNFKLFDTIKERKDNILKITSFNTFISHNDLKKRETLRQISHIEYIDSDILFLQECSNQIEKNLLDYKFIKTASHCGYTYLFVKKNLQCDIIDFICQDGIILSWMKTIYGEFVFGSLHMIPYNEMDDKIFRKEQIEMLCDWIITNNLQNLPIIIGGDTNMDNLESKNILEINFLEELSNFSYPNRNIIYKKARNYASTIKEDYKYDKFFIKNVKVNIFQTINTYDSDHFLNYLSIYL